MKPKISVLITAWKEEKTIAKVIRAVAKPDYSGIREPFEILLAAPDTETYEAALVEIKKLGIEDQFVYVKDEQLGKPIALNMLLEKATGEFLIFTDGDVYFGNQAIKELIKPLEENDSTVLVTGRPKSEDSKDHMMGYFGHLLADAAHHKRTVELTNTAEGKGLAFITKNNFFPVSGYIYAARKSALDAIQKVKNFFPEDCLVDDAYISYVVQNSGGKVAYAPKAIAFVKYPTNLSDYFKQKKRSTGGYVQLWEYGIVRPETKTRSFRKELEYFWFPIKYATNTRQFFWSLFLYPTRLWLWIMIYWERRIRKKDFVKTWVRIESTK